MNKITLDYDDLSRYSLILMVMCLSHSTAAANVSLLLFLIFGMLSKMWVNLLSAILNNSFLLMSILLFALLGISMLWNLSGVAVGLPWLTKYKKLLLIPLAYPFFREDKHKDLFKKGLYISLFLGMLISYLNYFGVINYGDCPATACSSHTQITLSALNNLLFILSLLFFLSSQHIRSKIFFLIIAAVSAYSVLFVLGSRTGQLTFLALMGWLIVALVKNNQWARINSSRIYFIGATLIVAVFSLLLLQHGSRLGAMFEKILLYKTTAFVPGENSISVDIRMEFFRKVFMLISEKPFWGWGVGGHEPELLRLISEGVTREQQFTFTNPHNEFLLWTVQLGLVGLIIFSVWICIIWKHASNIRYWVDKVLMQSWIVIFVVGCLFNSFLIDFTEGYMLVLLSGVLISCKNKFPEK